MKLEIKSFRTKVARRIFILFIICAIVPISALALISFGHVRKQLKEQSQERLHQESKSMAVSIYERLFLLSAEMRVLAFNVNSRFENTGNIEPGVSVENLTERFNGLAHFSGKVFTPLLGQVGVPPELTPGERAHIFSDKALLKVQTSDKSDPPICIYAALDPEHPSRGILLGKIRNDYLWEASDRRPPLTELYVLDKSYHILFSFQSGSGFFLKQFTVNLSGAHSGQFEWRSEEKAYLASYSSIFLTPNFYSPPWIVVLSKATSDILAPMSNFNKSFPVLIILSLGMVFFLSKILIRKSMGPIEVLREATSAIGKGTFGHRVVIKSGDEFEALGNAFNEMSVKLEEGQKMLVKAAKMSIAGQMAAGVMHEIAQPLTAMHGLIQLALSQESSNGEKRRLGTVLKALERLELILARFKSFSQDAEECMEKLSLSESMEHVYNLFEHELCMKQIQATTETEADLPAILGDQKGLEQVISNLLINAINALETAQNGQRMINLKAHSSEGKVFLEIKDSGCGIPEEIQDRIFEPFFTTKEHNGGTGLGMTIIESILHKHQASIDIDSEGGAGTKITITFPAV